MQGQMREARDTATREGTGGGEGQRRARTGKPKGKEDVEEGDGQARGTAAYLVHDNRVDLDVLVVVEPRHGFQREEARHDLGGEQLGRWLVLGSHPLVVRLVGLALVGDHLWGLGWGWGLG